MKNYALHLLRMVLLPSSTISVLEIDAFGLLVGLFSTLPSLSEPSFESDVRGVPQFNPILVIKAALITMVSLYHIALMGCLI